MKIGDKIIVTKIYDKRKRSIKIGMVGVIVNIATVNNHFAAKFKNGYGHGFPINRDFKKYNMEYEILRNVNLKKLLEII